MELNEHAVYYAFVYVTVDADFAMYESFFVQNVVCSYCDTWKMNGKKQILE